MKLTQMFEIGIPNMHSGFPIIRCFLKLKIQILGLRIVKYSKIVN